MKTSNVDTGRRENQNIWEWCRQRPTVVSVFSSAPLVTLSPRLRNCCGPKSPKGEADFLTQCHQDRGFTLTSHQTKVRSLWWSFPQQEGRLSEWMTVQGGPISILNGKPCPSYWGNEFIFKINYLLSPLFFLDTGLGYNVHGSWL